MTSVRRAEILVAGLAIAAFLPSLAGGFVYDDIRFVAQNTAIRSLANVGDFLLDPRAIDPEGWQGIFRPARTLSFAIDHAIFGREPLGYHLTNLVLHAFASVLLLTLLRRLGSTERVALLGAILFAVHPVQAESVAWITSRGDVLSGALVLLLLVVHVGGHGSGRPHRILEPLILLAALLAKETSIVAPGLVVLLDVLVLRPRGKSNGSAPESLRRHARRVWLPLVATAATYFLFRQWRMGMAGPDEPFGHLTGWWGGSWPAQLVVAARGFLMQIGAMLFPIGSRMDAYPPTHGRLDVGALAACLALAALLALALVLRRRRPLATLGILWFLLTLLPTANVLFTVGILSADRFLYLPLAGVVLLVVPILARSRVAAVVLLVLLAGLSLRASRAFDDEVTFWASAAEGSPRRMEYTFHRASEGACDLWEEGKVEEAHARVPGALALGQAALDRWDEIARSPAGPHTLLRMANLHRLTGDHRLAARFLRRATRMSPEQPRVLYMTGLCANALGDQAAAKQAFLMARDRGFIPTVGEELAKALIALAEEQRARGSYGLAVENLRMSLREWPASEGNEGVQTLLRELETGIRRELARPDPPRDDASAWLRRGIALAQLGETARAREILGRLHEAVPRNASVLVELARWVDEESGDLDLATRRYRRVLELEPVNLKARYGLVRCGSFESALADRTPAEHLALLRGLPDEPLVLLLRARVLDRLGRRAEALTLLRAAVSGKGPGALAAFEHLDAFEAAATAAD